MAFAYKDSEIFVESYLNKAVLQRVCNMSALVFLSFRVERVLCDGTDSCSHCADRGFSVALHLLL